MSKKYSLIFIIYIFTSLALWIDGGINAFSKDYYVLNIPWLPNDINGILLTKGLYEARCLVKYNLQHGGHAICPKDKIKKLQLVYDGFYEEIMKEKTRETEHLKYQWYAAVAIINTINFEDLVQENHANDEALNSANVILNIINHFEVRREKWN